MPGIAMSLMTTSTGSFAIMLIASVPSAAQATSYPR